MENKPQVKRKRCPCEKRNNLVKAAKRIISYCQEKQRFPLDIADFTALKNAVDACEKRKKPQ